LGAGCKKRRRPGAPGTGRGSGRYRLRLGPSGAGGRIRQCESSVRAKARSAVAARSSWSRRELRASPAVSPACSRRPGGAGQRRGCAARARGRERGSGGARRAAAPHGRRAGPLRRPLAFARPSQPGWRSLGGRGPARARAPPGGGLAAATLAALGRSGRSIRSRSPPLASALSLRRRPGPTNVCTSSACPSRPCGCPAAGEGGAAAALRQFCALFEFVECSGVRTMCWWSRSIA